MPDGHIDRDIQILVHDRQVTVDIRMAASDVTWIEIIRLAESRTRADTLIENGAAEYFVSAESAESADDSVATTLPTTEEEVAAWLLNDPNRRLLEEWVTSTCHLRWCDAEVTLGANPTSRPDSRHHWSINFSLQFELPEANDEGEIQWIQAPFVDYPGKVRRAIKTRGEPMIDRTDVSPLVVRAEFEIRDEESTPEQRSETITALLRLR